VNKPSGCSFSSCRTSGGTGFASRRAVVTNTVDADDTYQGRSGGEVFGEEGGAEHCQRGQKAIQSFHPGFAAFHRAWC
jgi:hypothetical protein